MQESRAVTFAKAYWEHISSELNPTTKDSKDLIISNFKVSKSDIAARALRTIPYKSLTPYYFSQPSKLRLNGGYQMWDFIIASQAQGVRAKKNPVKFSAVDPRKAKPTNEYWRDAVWKKYAYQDEGLLDNFKYCVDLTKMVDHFKVIDLAAQMAYRKGDKYVRSSDYWDDHASNSYYFAKALAELSVAKMLNLPLDLSKDEPLPFGIAVRPSLRVGFTNETSPLLQEYVTTNMPIDRNLVYLCVAIEVGADPKSVTTRSKTVTESCAWAYLPQKVFLAGWETAAWVMLSTLSSIDRVGWTNVEGAKTALTTHCMDLLPASSIDKALTDLTCNVSIPNTYYPLDYWLNCDVYKQYTEVVPCTSCFLTNPNTESVMTHAPYHKKFIPWAKKGETKGEDELALEDYKRNLFVAFNNIRKARRTFYVDSYPSVDEASARKDLRNEVVKKVRKEHNTKRKRI